MYINISIRLKRNQRRLNVKLPDNSTTEFNPMINVPTTDEEVLLCLTYGRDRLTGANLRGIYQCRREKGEDLLTAYEYTLMVHIKSFKEG
jgi:hypothetical protein